MSEYRRYIFNPKTLLLESKDLPSWLNWVKYPVMILGAVALFVFYLWFYTSVLGLELPKTAWLRRRNVEWKSKLQILGRQVDLYENTLSGIEARDDKVYRAVFGMGEIEAPRFTPSGDVSGELGDLISQMDWLLRRSVSRSRSLDETDFFSIQAGDMVSRIPSVPPLSPVPGSYHLSSPFGYRIDPVYGGRRMHTGMDFAADVGVNVYCTADGIVEEIKYQFSGYGNMVLVDHGFGYKTLYAHLSSTAVTEGMMLQRGDLVGKVGKSGKATGPHLHYEVIYRGNHVNPYNYMDLHMPLDEYEAMVERRLSESEFNRKSTTSDILNRAGRNR